MTDSQDLYLIVERARESGAYDGLGKLSDYIVDGTLKMSISIGENVSFVPCLLVCMFICIHLNFCACAIFVFLSFNETSNSNVK